MARPRRQTYTMKQYIDDIKEGYISNNASTQRNAAWEPIVDGLAVTILTDDYIPPIILSERDDGSTIIVDGGSRTAAFRMICEGNHKIKSSVEDPIIPYKKIEKDDNGKTVFVDALFDIRNKTFEQFPEELQKKFYKYQLETVIHENCSKEKESKYQRRYNSNTGMNANQKMFLYIPNFADRIREIIDKQFFINYCDINDNDKEKGILERIIAESIMCMFYLDKWNKNGKKLAAYLNENANEEEFDTLNNNIKRLESVVTEDTKTLFNRKDCFIWFALFNKFTQYGLNDVKFGEFLSDFVNSLKDKPVDGKLFYTADASGSTKDKSVIIDKLHILETLMKEYLHIEDSTSNVPVSKEEFISELVDIPVDSVRDDMELYEETLIELENNTIKDGSKLLDDGNRLSLLAMVAYSYKHDIDLDDWMEEYAKNNTYIKNQKQNFLSMVESLKKNTKNKNLKILA